MSNGNSHDRLSQRVEEIERRIEDRAIRRDAEYAEIREALADLAARIGAAEKATDRGPGWIAVIGVVATAASLVGSLAWFALSQTIGPVDAKVSRVAADVSTVESRQENVRTRLARIEGRFEEVDERVDHIDLLGSRKWVNRRKE